MNNTNIHKSLIELEESLKELNSAKSQVTDIKESSVKLIEGIKKATEAVTTLDDGLNKELDQFVIKLEEQTKTLNDEIESFQSSTTLSADNTEKRFYKLSNKIDESIKGFNGLINKFNNKLDEATGKIEQFDLESSLVDLKNNITNDTNNIKSKIEDTGKLSDKTVAKSQELLVENSKKLHNELETRIDVLKSSIQTNTGLIKSLSEKISEHVNTLEKNIIYNLKESQEVNQKWLKIIFFTSLIGVLGLAFLIVYSC